jgi:hypothetical protein
MLTLQHKSSAAAQQRLLSCLHLIARRIAGGAPHAIGGVPCKRPDGVHADSCCLLLPCPTCTSLGSAAFLCSVILTCAVMDVSTAVPSSSESPWAA